MMCLALSGAPGVLGLLQALVGCSFAQCMHRAKALRHVCFSLPAAGKEKHARAHAAGRFMVVAERWEESAPASVHVNPAVAGELLVSHLLLLPLSPLPASSSSTHERVLGAFKKMRKAALAGNTHTFTKVRRI